MPQNVSATEQSIFAIYADSSQYRATIRFAGLFDSFPISEQTFNTIRDAAEITDSAGYDDDASARIWWLAANNCFSLLSDTEAKIARELLWALRVEVFGPSGMPGGSTSRRGSMNVMNRIAHKRRRNAADFF